jgi:hypothetical protein
MKVSGYILLFLFIVGGYRVFFWEDTPRIDPSLQGEIPEISRAVVKAGDLCGGFKSARHHRSKVYVWCKTGNGYILRKKGGTWVVEGRR